MTNSKHPTLQAILSLMQDLDEMGGPQGQEYINAMHEIACVAMKRASVAAAARRIDQDIIRLAREFGTGMQESLTRSAFRETLDLNKAESDSNICHSHDFCDANEVMIEAFQKVYNRAPDASDNSDAYIVDTAWTIAKEADFYA